MDGTLDKAKAIQLANALSEPILANPDLDNLRITTPWLLENMMHVPPDPSGRYLTKFTDLATIRGILPLLYDGRGFTDGSLRIVATILFNGKERWEVSSISQAPYALATDDSALHHRSGNVQREYFASDGRVVAGG